MKLKRYLFVAFCTLLFSLSSNVKADEIIIGEGNANSSSYNGLPFYHVYQCGWSENLYSQEDLAKYRVEEGEINSISIQLKNNDASRTAFGTLQIWLANTSLTSFSTSKTAKENADYILVYEQPNYVIPSTLAADTWITYDFLGEYGKEGPFEYTGDGLIVYICYTHNDWTGGTKGFRATQVATAGSRCFFSYYDCSNTPMCGVYQYGPIRPNYQLDIKLDIDMGPSIRDIHPSSGLFSTSSKGGDIIVPYIRFNRKYIDPVIQAQYQVLDPNGQVVFEAIDALTGSNWVDVPASMFTTGEAPNNILPVLYFKKARGFLADTSNPDTAKISFRRLGALAGNYQILAKLRYLKAGNEKLNSKEGAIEIIHQYDMSLNEINEPLSFEKTAYKYPFSSTPLRISFAIGNKGKEDISNFLIQYRLEKPNSISGTDLVWSREDTVHLQTPMKRGDIMSYDTEGLVPNSVVGLLPGTFYLHINLVLLDEVEENLVDNSTVREGLDVRLEYPYNGVLDAILSPLAEVYKNQPVLPKLTVRNTGAFAISEVPVTVIIKKNGLVVYDVTEYVPYLAERGEVDGQDVVDFEFSTAFVPVETGIYEITAIVSKEDDSDTTDNTRTAIFNVLGSLSGTITVGQHSTYKTVKDALDAVYTRGIDGTVTFVLSDPVMQLGNINSEYALDFSSSISGFNTSTNKIRFVPSKSLSRMEGGVTLRLSSRTGIGIRFGSSIHSSEFAGAAVNRVQFLAKRDYYPFNAVVEFDGGSNKSIRFAIGDMPLDQGNRILLYFAEGASNISIKNCLLTNVTSNSMNLPLVLWNREKNEFTYDGIRGLSACVLLRSIPPMDEFGLNRTYNLDTLINRNILIENNTIENGAYGIVSIGIGALYNASKGQFQRYYNYNNHIANNILLGQTRAGIYMGYEENSRILNNRIHFIGHALQKKDSADIAGIILGGEGKQFGYDPTIDAARFERFGYNNINIKIDGNEISKIVSNNDVYGIKIEQERNNFYDMHILHGKHPFMPNVDDSIKVYNNLVWDLSSKNINGSRYGIRLFTTRDNKSDNYIHNFAIQKELGYNILSSSIINNSVIIGDDGFENEERACLAGIVAQNVDKFRMFNNAINLLDKDSKSDIVAPVVLGSVRPEYVDIVMDHNIYYSDDSEQVIARYIELSRIDNRVNLDLLGYRNEYVSIDQWQLLTHGEASTTTYNFIGNLDTIKRGVIPFIRIKSPVPIGSYLNNRGKVIPEVVYDIDGNLRGVADQGYDIGCWEFDGQLYDDDLGFLAFIEPVAYKDNRETSPFSDAEYVMTTSPVNVRVNIRNNGSVFAENKPIVLTIYNTETNQEVLKVTQDFSIGAFEIKTLDFQTNNKELSDRLFTPVPYGLDNPNTPSRFSIMGNNVTPVYRLVVELPVDEDLTNNTNKIEKLVRFYIKRSSLHLLLSADNTTLVDKQVGDYYKYIDENIELDQEGNTLSDIVGFTNYKALRTAFEKLGYSLQENDITGNVIQAGFDILDRSNWEPHSVNYTPYHSIFWSDGLEDVFTEEQEKAVNNFLSLSSLNVKRNLIISSEELARNSYSIYTAAELEDYFYKLFNTQPKGNGIYATEFDINGLAWLSGSMIAPNLETSYRNTLLFGSGKDVNLQAGIFEHLEQAGSNTRVVGQSYYYKHPTFVHRNLKSMGVISYSLKDFLIYLGLDWRHYSSPEFILSGIIDFINNNAGSIIPVQLLSFDVFAGSNRVYLTWETASEYNSDKFIVERSTLTSAGKSSFDIIDEVQAAGTTTIGKDYSIIDTDVVYGNTYSYRLKFVDLDGTYSYSDEKFVTIDEGSQLSFEQIVPNPVQDILTINFSLSSESDVRITLIDVSGKEVSVIKEGRFSSNLHSIRFDVSNIATGTYTVLINTNYGSKTQTINIVK